MRPSRRVGERAAWPRRACVYATWPVGWWPVSSRWAFLRPMRAVRRKPFFCGAVQEKTTPCRAKLPRPPTAAILGSRDLLVDANSTVACECAPCNVIQERTVMQERRRCPVGAARVVVTATSAIRQTTSARTTASVRGIVPAPTSPLEAGPASPAPKFLDVRPAGLEANSQECAIARLLVRDVEAGLAQPTVTTHGHNQRARVWKLV